MFGIISWVDYRPKGRDLNFSLKESSDGARTTASGRLFQELTTRCEKKLALMSVRANSFKNFISYKIKPQTLVNVQYIAPIPPTTQLITTPIPPTTQLIATPHTSHNTANCNSPYLPQDKLTATPIPPTTQLIATPHTSHKTS